MKEISSGISETKEVVEEFKPTEVREFRARQIGITAKKLTLSISGREKPIQGHTLVSQNYPDNPKPLVVTITEGTVLQSRDPRSLFIPEGKITISGEKEFPEIEKLHTTKGELRPLPVRDPDLTEINGRTFRQTGTLQIEVRNARVTLSR